MATNASRLLSSWMRTPGRRDDGSFDGQALRAWIDAVLPLLDKADRRAVGEIHIGHVFAFAPPDPDGTWPCVEIRDLLEELQLETVEESLRTQLYNNRGVTSRHPEAGGEQERELATRYEEAAQQFNDRWPSTAAILRSLASDYKQEAGMHEAEAERLRKGFNP